MKKMSIAILAALLSVAYIPESKAMGRDGKGSHKTMKADSKHPHHGHIIHHDKDKKKMHKGKSKKHKHKGHGKKGHKKYGHKKHKNNSH